MGDLAYRQGPTGYVPSGEARGASAEERLASILAALRGMLPMSREWLDSMIQMLMQEQARRDSPGIPGVNGALPPVRAKNPRDGMLPLPAAPRG